MLETFDADMAAGEMGIAGNSTKSVEDTLASPITGQPLVLGPTGGNVAPQSAGLYILVRPLQEGRRALINRTKLHLEAGTSFYSA